MNLFSRSTPEPSQCTVSNATVKKSVHCVSNHSDDSYSPMNHCMSHNSLLYLKVSKWYPVVDTFKLIWFLIIMRAYGTSSLSPANGSPPSLLIYDFNFQMNKDDLPSNLVNVLRTLFLSIQWTRIKGECHLST